MFCSNCGSPVNNTDKVCMVCGKVLIKEEPPAPTPIPVVEQAAQEPTPQPAYEPVWEITQEPVQAVAPEAVQEVIQEVPQESVQEVYEAPASEPVSEVATPLAEEIPEPVYAEPIPEQVAEAPVVEAPVVTETPVVAQVPVVEETAIYGAASNAYNNQPQQYVQQQQPVQTQQYTQPQQQYTQPQQPPVQPQQYTQPQQQYAQQQQYTQQYVQPQYTQQQQQYIRQPQQTYYGNAPQAKSEPVFKDASQKVIWNMKQLAKSGTMITACVGETIIQIMSAIASLVIAVVGVIGIFGFLDVYEYYSQYDLSVPDVIVSELIVSIIILVVGLVLFSFPIRIITGLWQTVGQGSKPGLQFNAKGLRRLKNVFVTYFIFEIIVYVLGFLSIIISAPNAFGIITALFFALFIILPIIYRACVIGSLSRGISQAETGTIIGPASAFVGVMLIIAAALLIIETIVLIFFASFSSFYLPGGYSALIIIGAILSMLPSMLSSLFFGITIFRHRSRINKINYESYHSGYFG